MRLALRRTQLGARDDPAEIPIALGEATRTGRLQGRPRRATALRGSTASSVSSPVPTWAVGRCLAPIVSSAPTMALSAGRFRGAIELRRAVEAVAIEQRQRRIAQLGRALDERRGQRRAVEKRKGRRGMKLDVHDVGASARVRGARVLGADAISRSGLRLSQSFLVRSARPDAGRRRRRAPRPIRRDPSRAPSSAHQQPGRSPRPGGTRRPRRSADCAPDDMRPARRARRAHARAHSEAAKRRRRAKSRLMVPGLGSGGSGSGS